MVETTHDASRHDAIRFIFQDGPGWEYEIGYCIAEPNVRLVYGDSRTCCGGMSGALREPGSASAGLPPPSWRTPSGCGPRPGRRPTPQRGGARGARRLPSAEGGSGFVRSGGGPSSYLTGGILPSRLCCAQSRGSSPYPLARSQAHLRYPPSGARRPPETRTASSRARLDNHDPRPLLALDTQHGKARRRRHGRGLGVATPLSGECKALQETCVVRSKSTVAVKHSRSRMSIQDYDM